MMGISSGLASILCLEAGPLPLNPRLMDKTSLVGKLALGRPCLYHLSWNYRVTTMPTLHLCGLWGGGEHI